MKKCCMVHLKFLTKSLIGTVVMDFEGNLLAGTSTGGLMGKAKAKAEFSFDLLSRIKVQKSNQGHHFPHFYHIF